MQALESRKPPWWMLHWLSWVAFVVFAGVFIVVNIVGYPEYKWEEQPVLQYGWPVRFAERLPYRLKKSSQQRYLNGDPLESSDFERWTILTADGPLVWWAIATNLTFATILLSAVVHQFEKLTREQPEKKWLQLAVSLSAAVGAVCLTWSLILYVSGQPPPTLHSHTARFASLVLLSIPICLFFKTVLPVFYNHFVSIRAAVRRKRPWWMLQWPSWVALVVFGGSFYVLNFVGVVARQDYSEEFIEYAYGWPCEFARFNVDRNSATDFMLIGTNSMTVFRFESLRLWENVLTGALLAALSLAAIERYSRNTNHIFTVRSLLLYVLFLAITCWVFSVSDEMTSYVRWSALCVLGALIALSLDTILVMVYCLALRNRRSVDPR